MKYEDDYFETETREGFVVDTYMKRNWAVQMDLLSWLCDVCDENGLRVYADFGTLLGAVRHKGFVPWDDDIDVSMMRSDYNQLISILEDYKDDIFYYKNQFHGQTLTPFLRIVTSKRIIFNEDYLSKHYGWPFVTGIDIFPIDNISDDSQEEETRDTILCIIVRLMAMIKNGEDVSELLTQVEELTGFQYDREGNIGEQSFELFDMLASVFNQDVTKEVGVIAFYLKNGSKFSKEAYKKTEYLDFENMKIPAPIGYEEILHARYGDYMVPVKMSAGHDYPFYANQISEVEKRGIDWKSIIANYDKQCLEESK